MDKPVLQLSFKLNDKNTLDSIIGKIRAGDTIKLVVNAPDTARFITPAPSKVHRLGGYTSITKVGSDLDPKADNTFCWVAFKLGRGRIQLHTLSLFCHDNIWHFQEVEQEVQFSENGAHSPIYLSDNSPELENLLKEIVAPDFYAPTIPS